MKRYVAALLAVLGLLGVLGVGLAIGRGFAQNDENAAVAKAAVAKKCSKATLHGTYLIAQNGVIVKQTQGGAPQGPFASAGYEVYDGNGHIKSVASFNFNGHAFSNAHESGTYTVNSDCTGSEVDMGGGTTQHYDEFLRPDGDQFAFVQTDQGIVSAGTLTRIVTPAKGN